MAFFRQVVLKNKFQDNLSTLRFKCFALVTWVTKHARIKTLKISGTVEKRRSVDTFFDIVTKKSVTHVFSIA